jgi:hypothetical protein
MKKKELIYALAQSAFIAYVREGEGGAPPAGGAPQITPEVQALIDAQVAQQVAGLKAKNDELLGSNRQFKEKLAGFDGVDPVKYREYVERLDKDEDAQLLAAGKTTELVQKYTGRMRDDHVAQLGEKDKEIEAANNRAKRFEQAVLDNQIRQACTGMHPGAIEDALLYGRNYFSLDAEGNAVKLDAQGRPELGKDGKTPLSPAEWIESLKESKAHWFPASSSGSGSGGSAPAGQTTGKTITRAKFESLTPQQKSETMMAGTQIVN